MINITSMELIQIKNYMMVWLEGCQIRHCLKETIGLKSEKAFAISKIVFVNSDV